MAIITAQSTEVLRHLVDHPSGDRVVLDCGKANDGVVDQFGVLFVQDGQLAVPAHCQFGADISHNCSRAAHRFQAPAVTAIAWGPVRFDDYVAKLPGIARYPAVDVL